MRTEGQSSEGYAVSELSRSFMSQRSRLISEVKEMRK
jgi:hypothetical protein